MTWISGFHGTSVRLTAQASDQADQQAEQPGPGAEDQRVLERIEIEPPGQHLGEMIEAQTVLALSRCRTGAKAAATPPARSAPGRRRP